jgi:hypothetical protein
MNASAIVGRIDELMEIARPKGGPLDDEVFGELMLGATSVLTMLYGPKSVHLIAFQEQVKVAEKATASSGIQYQHYTIAGIVAGVLKNTKREIASGLIGSLTQQVTGDVLTDFMKLSRIALEENNNDAKNVAAVLAAAAFEDAIRRMGTTLAGAAATEDLSKTLEKLKEAGIVQSPQIGIAQSYLSFRNHALHANWDKIQREAVQSVLGFTEQLLLKHFQ